MSMLDLGGLLQGLPAELQMVVIGLIVSSKRLNRQLCMPLQQTEY